MDIELLQGCEMPRWLVKEWGKRLRSGDYKQTYGALWRLEDAGQIKTIGQGIGPPRPEGFCCLGVLLDILPGTEWVGSDIHHEDEECMGVELQPGDPDTEYSIGEIPDDIRQSIGLTQEACECLMNMNDGNWNYQDHKWWRPPATFKEIADLIEKELIDENPKDKG